MNSSTTDNPLGYKKESTLLINFAIPCIISMLVTALYNIVDQIFIGQGIGMLGNAATNIAFPLSTTCTAISLLIRNRKCYELLTSSWGWREAFIRKICWQRNISYGCMRNCIVLNYNNIPYAYA